MKVSSDMEQDPRPDVSFQEACVTSLQEMSISMHASARALARSMEELAELRCHTIDQQTGLGLVGAMGSKVEPACASSERPWEGAEQGTWASFLIPNP